MKPPREFAEHTSVSGYTGPPRDESPEPTRQLQGPTLLGEAKRTVEVLTVAYICVFLLVNEVKHLSTPFLATRAPPSEKACS